jgi:hypothetical protein
MVGLDDKEVPQEVLAPSLDCTGDGMELSDVCISFSQTRT